MISLESGLKAIKLIAFHQSFSDSLVFIKKPEYLNKPKDNKTKANMNKRVIKKMNENSNTVSNSTTFIQKKHNAQLTGKKLLAKIATKEQKPTVFCPCLSACYVFGSYELYTNKQY